MAETESKKAGEENILERARSRFKIAIDAESENRRKELDDLKFLAASPDDHWQWPDDVYNDRTRAGQEGGARPCLTINKLPQHHRQVTNEQKMNRPQIRVQPANDKAATETADVYNGLIRHIQVASEADLAYDKAGDAQVAHGAGYFRVLTEFCDERSFDQDIVIAPLADRFKVYMDPEGLKQHPAGKKCRWGFIIEDLPKDEYEELYGEHPVDWNQSAIGDLGDWFPDKDTVRVAEYLEIEQTEKKLLLWQVGEDFVTSIEGEPMPEGVPMGALPVKTRTTRIPKCIWRKINGQAVIAEKEMPTKYIPICRMVGNEWIVEGKPVTSGIVRNAKDAQRMYNYNASSEVELNSLAPRAPFVAMDQQIAGKEDMWRNANRRNFGVLTYSAVVDESTGQIVNIAPPSRAQPQMPQAAIITAKLAAGDDIKATTGQYDPSLGNQSNETSGKAINARKVQSEVGTFHYVDNYARALRYAGCILIDMIPRVYDTKRIARILGEDGEADQVQLDPSLPVSYQETPDPNNPNKTQKAYNLGVGKYDLIVNVGPSFATQREEARSMLVELSQGVSDPAIAAVMRYLTVKNMDWSGAKEFADILKKMLPPNVLEAEGEGEELPPQAKAMMVKLQQDLAHMAGQLDAAKQAVAERDQSVKDLQGQLKGKNADALAKMYEADKKAESEIVKARASVEVARVQAATTLAQQPDNADLQALIQQLGEVIKAYDEKLAVLAQSTAAIAEQLRAFEIAAAVPLPNAA